jgi:DNA polymerase-3 subunit gamma/tau
MDYQVSARKYRPGTFEDVIGQPHVVQTLLNAIANKRIAHAFLFSGTRGVGKTTVARILAKALNCERGPTGTPCNTCANCLEIAQGTSVDVIEIDGASNTGVDDVREIRENVKFSPFRGSYRVYIIDEVHMLSNSAFNALLKTLEEPPSHVVFIFATTEIHKIPATILSRCQHYNFRRIARMEIIRRLRHVATHDGFTVEDRSLAAIARAGEGSMRDALSLLDQAVAFGGKALNYTDVETLLGSVPQEHIRGVITAILAQNSAAALQVVAQLLDQGHDLRAFCAELVEHVRNLMVAAVVLPASQGEPEVKRLQELIELSEEDIRQVVADSRAFTVDRLQELFKICTQAEDAVKSSQHPRFVVEVAVVRATRLGQTEPPTAAGRPAAAPSASAAPPRPREVAAPVPAKAEPNVRPGKTPITGAAPNTPMPPVPSAGKPAPAPAAAPVPSPEAPPTPAPRAAAPTSAVESPIRFDWEQVVERVGSEHPGIGAFLEQGTLMGVEGNLISIGYPKTAALAFGRMQKEDSIRLIMRHCTEIAGREVRVRIVELGDGAPPGPTLAEVRATRERDQKRALLDQARSHPVVKQALAVFGGDLVDVRQAAPRKESDS